MTTVAIAAPAAPAPKSEKIGQPFDTEIVSRINALAGGMHMLPEEMNGASWTAYKLSRRSAKQILGFDSIAMN